MIQYYKIAYAYTKYVCLSNLIVNCDNEFLYSDVLYFYLSVVKEREKEFGRYEFCIPQGNLKFPNVYSQSVLRNAKYKAEI